MVGGRAYLVAYVRPREYSHLTLSTRNLPRALILYMGSTQIGNIKELEHDTLDLMFKFSVRLPPVVLV